MAGQFLSDIQEIRRRAREHIERGALTEGYKADRQTVLRLLNEALATEIVCVLRYTMNAVAAQLGFSNWQALNASIAKDPKRHFHSREEIVELYRKYISGMKPELPKLFGRLPKADVLVMPVEQFREKEASGAQYNQGTPDGSRPGHVMVNTGDPESRKTIQTESTAYHE